MVEVIPDVDEVGLAISGATTSGATTCVTGDPTLRTALPGKVAWAKASAGMLMGTKPPWGS